MYSKKASSTYGASSNSRLSGYRDTGKGARGGTSLEQMTSAGDVHRANDTLKQGLQSIKFPAPYDEQQAKTGHPAIFMKILHYVLFYSSSSVRNYLYSKDIDPNTVHLNDQKFMERVFYIVTDIFDLQPQLQLSQFFRNSFAEQKMTLCSQVIEKVKSLHDMTKTITKDIRSDQQSSKSAGKSQSYVTPAKVPSPYQQRTAGKKSTDPFTNEYVVRDASPPLKGRSKTQVYGEQAATPAQSVPVSSGQANMNGSVNTELLMTLKYAIDQFSNRLSSLETNMTQKISKLEQNALNREALRAGAGQTKQTKQTDIAAPEPKQEVKKASSWSMCERKWIQSLDNETVVEFNENQTFKDNDGGEGQWQLSSNQLKMNYNQGQRLVLAQESANSFTIIQCSSEDWISFGIMGTRLQCQEDNTSEVDYDNFGYDGYSSQGSEDNQNDQMQIRNKSEKMKLIEQFLKSRYPLDHGYEHQEELKWLITKIIPDVKTGLSNHIFDKNPDAALWSDKNFSMELDAIINNVEMTVFQKHIDLQAIAIVAHSIEESPDRLNKNQKQIVLQLVCNSVLQRQFPATVVINDAFYRNVSVELVKKMKVDSDQFFDTSSAQVQTKLINFSQKQALRRMNPHTYCVSHLVKHYNLIIANRDNFIQMQSNQKSLRNPNAIDELEAKFLKTLDIRDQGVANQLSSLALAMLEIYRESEDTAELDDDCLKELITLAGMKHQEVYRRLLDQLIADIDNDHHFEILKLSGLAVIVLYMAILPVDTRKSYWNAEDLNCCLNLFNRKFSSILQSDAEMHEQQQCIYDTLSIVFSLAASLKIKGIKNTDASELLNKFSLNYTNKANSQESNTHDLFSLKMKTDYATQALERIGEKGGPDANEKVQVAFVAGAVQLKSFVKINMEHFASSLSNLQTLSSSKRYKWHEIVQKMQIVARTNFNLFKSYYLTDEDNGMKNETKKICSLLSIEDTERIAYYVIEELQTIARDKSYQYEDRIYAVDSLKAMYSNKMISKIYISWFPRTRQLQHYVKFVLKKLQNLPSENKNKEQISERAKSNLVSISGENEDLTCDRVVEPHDSDAKETNKMILKGLKQKMLVEDFISSLRTRSLEEYRREVKHLCLIDIQGDQYIDGKVAKAKDVSEKMKFDKVKAQKSDIYKYFQYKKGKEAAQEQDKSDVVNHVLLYEAVPIFLTSSSAVMLIQGDAGTGKSVFLKVVEQQMWKAYERGHTDFIPIFIRLAEIINPYNCVEELLRSQFAGRSTYTQMKNSPKKFLFMLDGYDELKSPKNMYITNRLAEWKGTVKVIMTSRQEYLTAYGNYQKYFKPVQEEISTLLEYRITDVSEQQRQVYIDKRIYKDQTRVLSLHALADKEEIALLKEWGSLEKYEQEIKGTRGLEELIKTPYMLTIIINILPELEKQKTSAEEGVTKSTIYKTFTKQHFVTQALRLMDNKGDPVPKGFDLEASFYNYSLDIAVNMYLENKTSIPAIESSYQYPSIQGQHNPFVKYFVDDVKTRLARSGVQMIIVDGKARFSHKSIMEYFAARVFYECIKYYKVATETESATTYYSTYINKKLLKGTDLTDQESDVLNFVVDMLKYNNIKQNEMKALGGEEEGTQQSINALEKLKAILAEMNKGCLSSDGERVEEVTWIINSTWQYNILLITCSFSQLLDIFDKRVLDAIYKCTNIPKNVREAMLIEAIYLAEGKNDAEEVKKLCCRYVAVGMDADEYEGEYTRPKPNVIMAHGHGKRDKDSETHEGEFENNELLQTGNIKIKYSNDETFDGYWQEGKKIRGVYKYSDGQIFTGNWSADNRNGDGELKYPDGRVYTGPFEEDEVKGEGCLSNPLGDTKVFFDTNRHNPVGSLSNNAVETNFEGREGEYFFPSTGQPYLSWYSYEFRPSSYRKTGIVLQNVEMSVEFKTSKQTCPIFALSYSGKDRQMMLRSGVPHIRMKREDKVAAEIKPTAPEDLELNFADNQWHSIKLVIASGLGKQMLLDGRVLATLDNESTEGLQEPDQIWLGAWDIDSENYFSGAMRNLLIKQYVPPDTSRKLVFTALRGEDLKVDQLDGDGLKGAMEFKIAGGDVQSEEPEQVYSLEATLKYDHVVFDYKAIADMLLEGHKQNSLGEMHDLLVAYMRKWLYGGQCFAHMMSKDQNTSMKILKKYYGDDMNKLKQLKLENHPGKAIAKIEEKSQDTYQSFPKSWYEIRDESEGLWVMAEPELCGEYIVEFFKQDSAFYNYSDNNAHEASIYGHQKGNSGYQHWQWWHINEDRTISPSRNASYAIGYNEEAGEGSCRFLLMNRTDERVLIFKELEPVYQPQGNIMPLILTSHDGKAIAYDEDERRENVEQGCTQEKVRLSADPDEAIKVWIDKDGCICDATNPYQCFNGNGYQSGLFDIMSKREPLQFLKFTVNADGTIGLKTQPNYVLGTDQEKSKIKFVKSNSEHKCIFKNFELLLQSDKIKS